MNRRRFLQAAGVSMALPMLDIDAQTKSQAKIRLACFYYPNGTTRSSWKPQKVGANGQLLKLASGMKSLEGFKKDIVIPEYIETPRGNGHGAGTATWLTGGSFNGNKLHAGGPSMDQVIAWVVGRETPIPSLELIMKGEGHFSEDISRNNISWINATLPTAREYEPRAVFDSMFRPNTSNLSAPSILDLIKDQANDIARQGSKDDKRKITEYLESVRSIEKKIQFTEKQQEIFRNLKGIEFKRPKAGIPENYQDYMRQMIDLQVLAFYADITRVSTFMMDHGQSNRYCNFVSGVKGTWHALSHWKDASGKTEDDDGKTSWKSVAEKKAMYEKVTEWHNEQFAYFLGRMKELKTPEGSLLDNSLVLYGSNLGDGHVHDSKIPVILAGQAAGKVKTGFFIPRKKRALDLNEWHLTAMRCMGLKADRFGTAKNSLAGYSKV